MLNQYKPKEARIFNGYSLLNGAGKTGQWHAKQWNWTTFLHHTQKQTQKGIQS